MLVREINILTVLERTYTRFSKFELEYVEYKKSKTTQSLFLKKNNIRKHKNKLFHIHILL